jgi:ABC-type phosphate transport system ATPase subunit
MASKTPHEPPHEYETVVEVRGGAFSYGGAPALRDVDFSLQAGHALALIGPNGSGKSTLLKGILGLIPQVEGSMATTTDESHIGYLPQNEHIDPEFPVTLKQVVMMGRYRSMGMFRFPTKADRDAVRNAIEAVGLTNVASDRFGSLSGGQQQRLCIARTIAVKPEIILMDEPCSALDPVATLRIEDLMKNLSNEYTIVIVTHNMQQAARVADRTAFFTALSDEGSGDRTGVLVEYDRTEKIFNNPKDQRTEDYVSGRFG